MKIKPSTLGLLAVTLLLGGITLIVAQQPSPKSSDPTEISSQEAGLIFELKEADVQTLSLQTRLRSLKFERDKAGKWQMQEPEKTAASDPSIAFLLDLVATGKSQQTLTAPASDREQFGLHQPLATIEVTLKDQKTHKLVIGDYNFNRSALYAQADPPADETADLTLLLVSPNFDNAVNRPLDEWKQPATAEKSPSPADSDSPTPASESPTPPETPEAQTPQTPEP